MTPEQKQIAIAEACNLFRLAPLKRTNRRGKDDPNGVRLWYCDEDHGGAKSYAEIPDYFNDLNAMHEAEKVLTSDQQFDYIYELNDSLGLVPLSSPASYREAVLWTFTHSTAADRAEAFGKTLNLW
jgi:hypothetical protein